MSSNDVLGIALADAAGPMKDLLDKFMGSEGLLWLAAFKRFLRKENPWPTPEAKPAPTAPASPTIKVWKTLAIGGKSRDELLAELEAANREVRDWARDMMRQTAFTTESQPREVDITALSVRELGFPTGAKTREIWTRVKDLGLELCPPSLVAHLWLAYGDQPYGEGLFIAIEQIVVSDGSPSVFLVEHDGDGRWLDGHDADPDDGWRPDDRLALVVPRR